MSNAIIYSNSANFGKDVLQSDKPVLVDFYADWCPPCQMIAPSLELLADEYQGKAKIVKINIDENEQTPTQFGVRGIPTLMMFKNGENVATKVGAMAKGQLVAFINEAV